MKQNLLILLFFIFTNTLYGQNTKYSFGIEGGPSYTIYRGNDIIKDFDSPGIRGMAGLYFKTFISEHSAFSTNFSYEIKGLNGKGILPNLSPCNCTTRGYLDYLVINLMYQIAIGEKKNFYYKIGTFGGYLLSKKNISTGNNFKKSINYDIEQYHKFDFGLTNGLGVLFNLNESLIFSTEIRNNFGLFNISKVINIKDGTVKSNATTLLIGFLFPIKRNSDKSFQIIL